VDIDTTRGTKSQMVSEPEVGLALKRGPTDGEYADLEQIESVIGERFENRLRMSMYFCCIPSGRFRELSALIESDFLPSLSASDSPARLIESCVRRSPNGWRCNLRRVFWPKWRVDSCPQDPGLAAEPEDFTFEARRARAIERLKLLRQPK